MRHHYTKRDFPVHRIRELLEPGPVVLVSSAYRGERNIMTMGWHMVMEFSPSLIGCIIAQSNHSFDLVRKSRACVINLPTEDMIDTVVKIGNSDGDEIDKFEMFGLTPVKGMKVKVPLIKECYANFECRLVDASLIDRYNFFIFKVVKALKATRPEYPKTVHYHGQGRFSTDGKKINKARLFVKWKDTPVF